MLANLSHSENLKMEDKNQKYKISGNIQRFGKDD